MKEYSALKQLDENLASNLLQQINKHEGLICDGADGSRKNVRNQFSE
jgi:hypothetical protein